MDEWVWEGAGRFFIDGMGWDGWAMHDG